MASGSDSVEAVVPSLPLPLPVQAGRAALFSLCCACGEGAAAAGGKAAAGRRSGPRDDRRRESGSLDRRGAHRALRRPRGSDRIGELFSLFRERRTDEGAGEGATEEEGGSGRGCKLLRHTTHSPLLVHPPTPHSRRRRRCRANGGTVIAEGEGGNERTDGEGTVKKTIIPSIRRRRRRRFDLRRRWRRRSLSRCCDPSGGVGRRVIQPLLLSVQSVGRRRWKAARTHAR